MNNMTVFSKPKVFSEFQVLAVSIDNRIREQAKRTALLAGETKKIRAVDNRPHDPPNGNGPGILSKVTRDSDGNPKATTFSSKPAEVINSPSREANGPVRERNGPKFKANGLRITDSQRRHRIANNLCLYCESPDHRVAQCSQIPNKGQGNTEGPQVRKARAVGTTERCQGLACGRAANYVPR
jgi:hypothetical protein